MDFNVQCLVEKTITKKLFNNQHSFVNDQLHYTKSSEIRLSKQALRGKSNTFKKISTLSHIHCQPDDDLFFLTPFADCYNIYTVRFNYNQ